MVTLGSLLVGILLFWLYKHSPKKIEFLGYYNKIGAHRVNTLEKLESSLTHFEAIELDLVYVPETNILDVHHPPAPSIELSFSTYVAALENKQPFMWLDIKNLDENTAELIFQKLNSILHDYPKQKILIETRFPEKLSLFTAEGYHTSYYLKQNLNKLNRTALDSEIEKIKRILETNPELGLSTEHFDYKVLKKYFPETKKYFWCIRHSKIGDYTLVREILKDNTVALVLTSYHPF
ncbi:hypothetical protein [Rasiella sp. SM2506]|uniref:hypothetical protein n=1 Tax=Rasiella sp. SM2506 TaxID=3423914 RepID=UPI003D7A4379